MSDERERQSTRSHALERPRVGPANTSNSRSGTSNNVSPSRWPPTSSNVERPPMVLVGGVAAAVAMIAMALVVAQLPNAAAQPEKYMDGAQWKAFLAAGGGDGASWFARWNTMAQPRIDQLAALAESSEREGEGGSDHDGDSGGRGPFRVALVGDSTMMQQHGVLCAFLGERPGRRFDPSVHQEECCVDTLPREHPQPAGEGANNDPTLALSGNATGEAAGPEVGGRGLCFRHHFQKFAEPPDWVSLGSPDAVYFGTGLHLLHMTRRGHPLQEENVQAWLNYERDLESAVETYRAEGGDGFRLVFTTCHTIQDSVYRGEFQQGVKAFRNNDDTEWVSFCENQQRMAAGGATGLEGYGVDTYCRQGLMDRSGSDILNRRSRPVMARLGVPVVEGDLIVKDQEWATPKQDGRHYPMLVPIEVWDLLGVLVSPFAGDPPLARA